jgi:hypothetical protein
MLHSSAVNVIYCEKPSIGFPATGAFGSIPFKSAEFDNFPSIPLISSIFIQSNWIIFDIFGTPPRYSLLFLWVIAAPFFYVFDGTFFTPGNKSIPSILSPELRHRKKLFARPTSFMGCRSRELSNVFWHNATIAYW